MHRRTIHPTRGRRLALLGAALAMVGAALWTSAATTERPAGAQVVALNPVEGNQGFLAVIRGDASLGGDESEGPVAIGGDLQFSQFQIIPASPPGTPVIGSDAQATALYVGGRARIDLSSGILQVNGSGFVKIGDLTNTLVRSTDPNGVAANTRIHVTGAGWDDTPRLQLTTSQPEASVAAPTPPLFDFDALFATYEERAAELAACTENLVLTDANGTPLPGPPTNGQAYVTMAPGTNVLRLDAADLAAITTLTFRAPTPSLDSPLLVDVDTSSVGGVLSWQVPNMSGIGSGQAPFIIWNFGDATEVHMTPNSATIEGTVYAPSALVDYEGNSNIEGNVIAADFIYRRPPVVTQPRELHNFQFAAELTCESDETTTTTESTTTSTSTSTSTTTTSTTSTSTTTTTSTTTPSASTTASTTTEPGQVLPASTFRDPGDAGTDGTSLPRTGGPGPTAVPGAVLVLAGTALLVTAGRPRRSGR